ncbi:helix-turn-helix domain-containing protein [Vibrio maerlii]|uniref:helix-turn-helix domain-containing protein n=1 Tax=Vibrio maerlii TaxID=2231648 RepID=UPI001F13E553|nr:helix-turn-helix transcriptional regulator [Vibrio maerlii]
MNETNKVDQGEQIADTQKTLNGLKRLMKNNKEMDITLVSRESVEFFASMFKEIDTKTYALLRSATIPNDIHTDVEYEYLPESSLKNFLEVLAEHLNNDSLGWLFLRSCKETYIPRFISVISERASVKDALEQFCQILKKENTGANVYLESAGNTWWLVREKTGLDEAWFKYAEMFSVLCMAELLRALTNDNWRPTKIGIQSPDIDDFSKLPSMEFAQFFLERPVTAIEIPESILWSPVKISTPAKPLSERFSADELTSLTFAEQFTLAITPYLSMGKLPIKIAAEILRMNVRTLQRKLSAEKIVYKQFVEDLVFEQVSKRIIDSDESITEIANRYGYSDAAHFTRSFNRIFGCSPSAYRKKYRH